MGKVAGDEGVVTIVYEVGSWARAWKSFGARTGSNLGDGSGQHRLYLVVGRQHCTLARCSVRYLLGFLRFIPFCFDALPLAAGSCITNHSMTVLTLNANTFSEFAIPASSNTLDYQPGNTFVETAFVPLNVRFTHAPCQAATEPNQDRKGKRLRRPGCAKRQYASTRSSQARLNGAAQSPVTAWRNSLGRSISVPSRQGGRGGAHRHRGRSTRKHRLLRGAAAAARSARPRVRGGGRRGRGGGLARGEAGRLSICARQHAPITARGRRHRRRRRTRPRRQSRPAARS